MKIEPIEPKPPSFGIYRGTRKTNYGQWDWGVSKDKNIEIYQDFNDKTKLFYVSDKCQNWIKSKLVYFENGRISARFLLQSCSFVL